MGEIIMRNWDLREFLVQVNWPSPIQQVRVPIRRVITPIRGLPNPIRQVVPLISHIRSYPPHRAYLHLHPPSLSFSSTTLTSLQNTKLSHPSLSHHVMMMSWHRVQHTPSTAYTEYSIHRVQHTPSTAYTESSIHRVQHTPSTQDCLSSLHSHDYELTPECSFSFRGASLHDRPPSASSPWELKGKVTLSHSHSCELTNWWIESQHPVRRPSTASKYSSKLAWLRPPSSLDHGLQVYLQTRLITASNLARSRPPSASPNSLDYACKFARPWPPSAYLQTRSVTASTIESPNSLSRSRSASLSSLDHGLQVHLQTRSITASMCISKLSRWPPVIVSPHSLDYDLEVHLQIHSITASKCISKVALSRPRSVALSSLDRHFQAHLELLSSAACSQSRYTVCRLVAI